MDTPKLVLNRETLMVLTDPRDQAQEEVRPRTRPFGVATCVTCYATCTC